MQDSFVGVIPPRELFNMQMMPDCKDWDNSLAKMPELKLSGVPSETSTESDIYQSLCDAVNNSGVCPGFKLICVAWGNEDCRPDLALIKDKGSGKGPFSEMESFVEIKGRRDLDAFYDSDTGESTMTLPVDKIEGESWKSRGQLIQYATTLMARQHRTCLFSIFVCGPFIRILRWDRSGCLVSERINFHENPELFAEYLWRYSHMSRVQRGYDPTATRATAKEGQILEDAIDRFIEDCESREMVYLRPERDESYVPYKVRVDDPNRRPSEYIIRQPFWDAESACDRSVRAYAAWSLSRKELVFLKDSWRDDDDDSEEAIYIALEKAGVPHLPVILAVADIKTNGEVQRTFTDQLADPEIQPEWRVPNGDLRSQVHCRLVQELLYPLSSAKSSRHLTQVMRDVVETIKVSYYSAGIFHCDISAGNVMIDKNGRGVLNDWDHAFRLTGGQIPETYRTGTWQFLSAPLLDDPCKPHQVHDDLESCFWVLLFDALYDFKHNYPSFNFKLFDEVDARIGPDGTLYAVGGDTKFSFLIGRRHPKWICVPFNELIQNLCFTFGEYNIALADNERKRKQLEELHAFIADVDNILKIFDEALALPGWIEDYGPTIPRSKMTAEQASKQQDMVQALVIDARNVGSHKKSAGVKLTTSESQRKIPRSKSPSLTQTKSGQVVRISGVKRPLELAIFDAPVSPLKRPRTGEAGPSRLAGVPPPIRSSSNIASEPTGGSPPAEGITSMTPPRCTRVRKGAKATSPARTVVHRYDTRSKAKGKQVEGQKVADDSAPAADPTKGSTQRQSAQPKTKQAELKAKKNVRERKRMSRTTTTSAADEVKETPRPRRSRRQR